MFCKERNMKNKLSKQVKAGNYQEIIGWPLIEIDGDNDGAIVLPTGRILYDDSVILL